MAYEQLPIGQIGNYQYPAPMPYNYSSRNPQDMMYTNWVRGANQADILDQQMKDWLSQQRAMSDYYGQAAANSYGNMQGLSPEEIDQIVREAETQGLQLTPEQIQQMYLNPDEQASMTGDVSTWTSPQFTWDQFNEGEKNIRGAQTGLEKGLQGGLETLRGGYAGIDPTQLAIEKGYLPGMEGSLADYQKGLVGDLSTVGKNVRGAIDPTKLGVSEGFSSKYLLSPESQQAMVNQAAQTVGSRFATLQDDAARRAAASGNTSPEAVAAIKERLNAGEAGTAGDVMANARLNAANEAALREMNLEQMRQQANRGIASMQLAGEQYLGSQGLAAKQAAQAQALGARQSGEQLRQEGARAQVGQQYQQARDIGMTELDAAKVAGQSNIDVNKGILSAGQATTRYADEMAKAQEQERANRAAGIATNRQQVSQYVPAQQFQRGQYINTALSDRWKYPAATRIGLEQEKRGFETGQQQYYGNQAANTMGQRIGLYGTSMGAANTSAGQMGQYELGKAQQPKWWEKVIGGVVGGLAGANPASTLGKVAVGAGKGAGF